MYLAPFKYLIIYPFLPLTIAKSFCLICSTLLLYLFFEKREFNAERVGLIIAICNLIAVLVVTNSLWFTAQKFYWKSLDIGLSISAFLLHLCSVCSIFIYVNLTKIRNDSIFWCILLLQGYLLAATGFSCIWSFFWTTNTVSTLLIAQWGASTTNEEIEFFIWKSYCMIPWTFVFYVHINQNQLVFIIVVLPFITRVLCHRYLILFGLMVLS